ncbi:tRNA (5-methylaminomethyl-2-thiouridine)(34)-methyltransferase MnmD [Marinilabilia rubra]|uniref:SAM-dependent methyltransferase n=1 Tax=Marinilabilia rubra TaxID=2162893 RepID=A0A2U2B6T0_9BACT|nr:tRNA (5-methylaminomethyl-2-thiouridine)(34)-methyltransferase MnmD [Marinilabilia rubra]PWD98744.1 SAM-dependent methyltransferase [Marinilabilia rubra]
MSTNHPSIQLKISEDGSSTLYRPDLDEHYHSIHGAIQESMHVFIEAGFNHHPGNQLNILEIGFGTGLNALLTLLYGQDKNIYYHSLERYPVNPELVSRINYPDCLHIAEAANYFEKLHEAPWNSKEEIHKNFTLFKEAGSLEDFNTSIRFDLIYFDAFAPDKQPELWTPGIFEYLAQHMNEGGTLTTYSAKGTVKRALKSAGLSLEKIPGPPGKRDMLRAVKRQKMVR